MDNWELNGPELECLLSLNDKIPSPQNRVLWNVERQLRCAFGQRGDLGGALKAVDLGTGRCLINLCDDSHFRAMFGFNKRWWMFDSLNIFSGFDTLRRCLLEVYPSHQVQAIALRPQADVTNCGLWAEWASGVWSTCTNEEAFDFEKHMLARAAAVGVSDLGDHTCPELCAMANTPAALANTNFILRRKVFYRGSELAQGVIYRTECPRIERARAQAESRAKVAADALAGPQPGHSKAEPMELDQDDPCIGGGTEPGSRPWKCAVSEKLARTLQGLVVERYLHQRQSAELRRQKATADAESQASHTTLLVACRVHSCPSGSWYAQVYLVFPLCVFLQAMRPGLKKKAKTAKKSTPESKRGAEETLPGASPEAQATLPTAQELRKMKVAQLKEEAQKRGIPTQRLKKDDLLAALLDHLAIQTPEHDTSMAVVSAQ